MKIGIITIHGFSNYGNRLQNIALQHALQRMGWETRTIRFEATPSLDGHAGLLDKCMAFMRKFKRLRGQTPEGAIGIVRSFLFYRIHARSLRQLERDRTEAIRSYAERWTAFTDFTVRENEDQALLGEAFDWLVLGSDQIWNPYFRLSRLNRYGDFQGSQGRLAYSASIGTDEIPIGFKGELRQALVALDAVSVREDSADRILDDLDIQSMRTPDPTLLLDEREWERYMKAPVKPPTRPFALVYCIGSNQADYDKDARRIASMHGLEEVHLSDIRFAKTYALDPGNFLWLLRKADLVLTNSFHGCIFSILMKRPFLLFERKDTKTYDMVTRMETLLVRFDANDRKQGASPDEDALRPMDRAKIDGILDMERELGQSFLLRTIERRARQEATLR